MPINPHRRQQHWESAHTSNQQQLARKAAEAAAQQTADKAFRNGWGVRLQQLREEERQEVADARARALEVQRFQQWQAARRTLHKESQRKSDIQAALMAQTAVDEAQHDFDLYAATVEAEAQRKGLPLKPIQLYLQTKESPITAPL